VTARGLSQAARRPFPFIRKVFADAGYQGPPVAQATSIAVGIVKRKPDQAGFAAQPGRWVVERFFAWIGRNRRLWKDAEATIGSATAYLYAAAVMNLVKRIARSS
jgi:transposase